MIEVSVKAITWAGSALNAEIGFYDPERGEGASFNFDFELRERQDMGHLIDELRKLVEGASRERLARWGKPS